MPAKPLSHREVSARGGQSKSPAKQQAVRRNIAKAREALASKRAAERKTKSKLPPP